MSRRYPTPVGRISGGGLSFGDFSLATQRKVTRPRPKGGRNPVEGEALASCAVKPHQGANRRLWNPASVCRRGTDDFLRCNALRLLHTYGVPLRGEATPPHQLRERPNTLRYSNLRFDNVGGLWVPSPCPSPKGRGDKDAGSGNKQEIEREPIRLPFRRHGQWHLVNAALYRLVAAFIPSTNSFRRVSICSGFWWWVSMIFTTAEPEMAPAAPAAMASRT